MIAGGLMSKTTREIFYLSVLVFTGFLVIYGMGDALVPLLISAFFAYLMLPVIKKLELRGVNKVTAISLALTFVLLVILIAFALVIPVLVRDLKQLITDLPAIAETAVLKVDVLLAPLGFEIPVNKPEIAAMAKRFMADLPLEALRSAGSFMQKALGGVVGLLLSVLNVLLIPIFFFYVMLDWERMVLGLRSMMPMKFRIWFDSLMTKSADVMSAYFRGQLLVSLILGMLYGIGFASVGLKFGFVIGLFTGLLNVIPYAGPVIGLTGASLVALANYESFSSIGSVWVVFAIVQSLESFVITPKIVGDRVGLNALETMIVLIVGGNLGGFVGMLVAIPVAGVAKFILQDCKVRYLRSDFYMGVASK
jgi:predicted PurR-regulated permease PerM